MTDRKEAVAIFTRIVATQDADLVRETLENPQLSFALIRALAFAVKALLGLTAEGLVSEDEALAALFDGMLSVIP